MSRGHKVHEQSQIPIILQICLTAFSKILDFKKILFYEKVGDYFKIIWLLKV